MSQQTLRTFSVLTRWIIGAIFCLSFAFAPSFSTLSASSSIPQFFNYQGRLLTSGGTNVTDGTYAIKFSLYDAATGGTPIWTASGTTGLPTALNVTVTNGLFSVLLGDSSFQSQNTLSNLDWDQDGLYLGVTIAADSEMSPRKKLSSVPFALNAGQLQGQYASSSVASTGGSLFEVHQTTADAASAQRTALSIKTEGTNNSNDFLIVGKNDSTDVFTVSRQGSVTTTGNLASNGNVTLGDTTSDRVVFNAYVMSDVLPATDLAYRLGDATHRWLGLDVGTVTTTNLFATTVSSTNGLFTNATSSWLGATTVSTTQLFVNGQAISSGVPATTATLQTITTNGATTTNLIYAFGGLQTSNLTATGTTSLQGTTLTSATATAVTSTNLFSTFGTITTLGSTYLTATQATATTLAFTSASGSSLLVAGQNVCLANGTNCQAMPSIPAGSYVWTDDPVNNLIYNTTSSRDVLMGGSTTATAGFIFDKGTNTSTVIVGNGTGNANLLVGTTTYGGGLNSNFQVNGNDVYAQGMIGSQEGLFSATGVTVGLGTTVYGDGNLYKTNAGDFTLALNNTASNWRFRTGVGESFTVASTGNVGIGVTTPLEALDVSGTIRNVISSGTVIRLKGSVSLNAGAVPVDIEISGRYGYVSNFGQDTFNVLDFSNPNSPTVVGTTTFMSGTNPGEVAVAGSFAYVTNQSPTNTFFNILDISNPSNPRIVGTSTLETMYAGGVMEISVQGNFAYLTDWWTGKMNVVDISNPTNPIRVGSSIYGLHTNGPWRLAVQGKYAYTVDSNNSTLNVIDVSNPSSPINISTSTIPDGVWLQDIAVSGRYAYTVDQGADIFHTIDISNPYAPVVVATMNFPAGTGPEQLSVTGRYAYVTNPYVEKVNVIDISNPTAPVILNTVNFTGGQAPFHHFVSGKYIYFNCVGDNTVKVYELPGLETSALLAHSAEVGSLSVLTNASIYNQLTVGGGLTVGPGGLLSQGSLAVGSTNTTSTFVFAVSSSYAEISNRLTVGGVNVCLSNGTNCQGNTIPVGAYVWTDVAANNTIYNTTTSRDVLIGGSTTDTANFILDKSTGATSTVIIGSGTGNANLLVGTTTYDGGLNANFVMDGNDIFASGMIGSKEGLFSATGVTVGLGSTIYGDGNLYKTTAGDFTLALNNTASNWRFRAGGNEALTIASTSYVGIGVNSPLEALDVSGTIQSILQPGQTLNYVASTTFGSGSVVGDLVVSGRYAYVADQGFDSMQIIDVSNVALPRVISTTTFSAGSDPNRIEVAGQYAYVSLEAYKSINVLNISNPTAPFLVASTTLGVTVTGLSISGPYLYVTKFDKTLDIIDISNPTSPTVIGNVAVSALSIPRAVAVQNRYAYIVTTSPTSTVSVVDVANPAAPVLISETFLSSNQYYSRGIAVSGRYVYVSDDTKAYIVDVANPAAPVVTAQTSPLSYPMNLSLSGRYIYTSNYQDNTLTAIDVSVPSSPVVVATGTVQSSTSNGNADVFVSGRYAYVIHNYGAPNLVIFELKGTETTALSAGSAEMGTLSVLTNADIYNQLTVGGGLIVGPGGILSQGALAISSTNTTSTFTYAVSTTYAEISNRLTVGGVNVCLYSGTNCPAGWNLWSENSTGNVVYMASANRDLLVGGSTSDTAGFIYDKGIGSSNVIIGGTTDTNLLVGTTTYGGGLNAGFALDGDDVFAQGMVGSIEGLFSATGVTVGLGSTIYGDGNLYKTTAGDFTLALNNTASNWRFRTGLGEALTVASTSYVGIGVSTPLEALDVSGTIQNIFHAGQSFNVVSSTTVGDAPQGVAISGHYAYVVNAGTSDNLQIWDVAYPQTPVLVGSVSVGNDPQNIQVAGRYAYIAHSGSQDLYVVDISGPATPYVVGTLGLSVDGDADLFLSGNYLYTNTVGGFNVVDISNPSSPTILTSVTESGATGEAGIYVQGSFLYVNTVDSKMSIYNISNPAQPTLASSTLTGVDARRVVVNGSYAYVSGNSGSWVILDITSSTNPTIVATYNGVFYGYGLAKAGRYLYVANALNGSLSIFDVSSSTLPSLISTVSLAGGASEGLAIAGRYAYVTDATNDKLSIVDLKGMETSAFNAGNAEIGNLQVLDDVNVAGRLFVNGGMSLGYGGLVTQGILNVNSTNTTSTFAFAMQAAAGEFSSRLTVGGVSVCLANGSNCPAGTTLWTENSTNNLIYQTNANRDVLLGGSTTDTAGFIFDKGTTTSTVIVGNQTGNANLLVGTTTYGGGLNSSFQTNGNDIFAQGMIGSIEGLFSATGVTVGLGSTVYGDGNIYKTTAGDFTLSLNNSAASWRFRAGGSEALTIASTSYVGVGVTTPTEALDVNGSIQNILRTGQTFTVVTSTQTLATPKRVFVSGRYAYVTEAGTTDKLQIFDVTNVSSPTSMGSVAVGDNPASVYVANRYAYVMNQSGNSMSIVDVSIPAAPTVAGTYALSGGARDIQVSGKYAYLAQDSAFDIVDISDPANPIGMSTVSFGSYQAAAVWVSGRYAYLGLNSGPNGKLAVVDISNPGSPYLVTSSTITCSDPRHVEVVGRYAYINGNDPNQSIVDISNPSSPTEVSAVNVPLAYPTISSVQGRYWYIRSGFNGNLIIYDVSNPASPVSIATQSIAGSAGEGAFVSGRYLYSTAETTNELVIVDVKGTETNALVAASAEVGSLQILTNGTIQQNLSIGNGLNVGAGGIMSLGALAVSATNTTSTFLYAVSSTYGMFNNLLTVDGRLVVNGDASTPALEVKGNISNILQSGQTFSVLVTTSTDEEPQDIDIAGRYAFIVNNTSDTLQVFDFSNPSNPSLVSRTNLSSSKKVAVSGNFAYILGQGGDNTLKVVDISRIGAPVQVATTTIGTDASDLAVSGKYVYITHTNSDDLYVMDVSNPTNPTVAGTVALGGDGQGVVIGGKYAYVALSNLNQVKVVDISNPGAPTVVTTVAVGGFPYAPVIQGRYLYVDNYTGNSISIIDIGNPLTASVIATSTGYNGPGAMSVAGRYMYVPNYGSNYVNIVDISVPTSTVILATTTVGTSPIITALSGRYLFAVNQVADSLSIVDVKGIETNGLSAASAEVGSLQVLTNGIVGQDFTVNGALTVGVGGILSNGPLAVQGTSTLQSLVPMANNSYDLGTSSYAWRNAYSSGTFYGVDLSVASSVSVLPTVGASFNVVTSSYQGASATPNSVFVQGKYIYSANGSVGTLTISDISNPAAPSIVSTYAVGGNPNRVYVAGMYAYVSLYDDQEVAIVDISNPANPRRVGSVFVSAPTDLIVRGKFMYVEQSYTTTNLLHIFDITDPTNPIEVGSVDTQHTQAFHIALSGNYLYTSNNGDDTISVIDIRNPFAPVYVTAVSNNSQYIRDFAVQGRYLYVGSYYSISIYDISNPALPTLTVQKSLGFNPGAEGVAIAGRYMYTANALDSSFSVIDVSSSTNPVLVTQQYLGITLSLSDIFVAGEYAYISAGGNGMVYMIQLKGTESAALIAHSAEVGSLQVLSNASVVGNLSVGGGLNIGPGGIMSLGSLAVASTNTTSTFAYAVSSTNGEFSNRLTVGGVAVCLQSGTNCPALPMSAYAWTDSPSTNVIYNSTSTRDIMMGGSTTATAGFIFDKGTGATSTVIVGSYTGNANLFVGTTTYGGGLNSNFTPNGNDIFAQGMIGSLEGLFSATGVTVGSGSTIYGDGYLYKTTAGDFTLSLNVASTSWRFNAGGAERLTVASSGNIGIGVATPLSALDVNGSLDATPHSGTVFSTVTTTYTGGSAYSIAVNGRYAYVGLYNSGTLKILDVSDASNPVVVGTATVSTGPSVIIPNGRYLYVVNNNGVLSIVDVSNPATPSVVSSLTVGVEMYDAAYSGGRLFIPDFDSGYVYVVNVSDPVRPYVESSSSYVGSAQYIAIQGRYAFVSAPDNGVTTVFDISNPASMQYVTEVYTFAPTGMAISGRYLYAADAGTLKIVDISNAASPVVKATTSNGLTSTQGIAVSGKFAYVVDDSAQKLVVFDVSSSTSPVLIGYANTGVYPFNVAVAGRYAYVPNYTVGQVGSVSIIDIMGIETNGLVAASAEVGSLQVLTNGSVFSNFSVGGALTVGQGGIYTNGNLGVYGTSTLNDSIIGGSLTIGTTSTNISERLQVEGNVLIRKRALAVAEAWNATGTSYTNAPTGRTYHATAWTGSKMIVWGGTSTQVALNTGGIYDPINDTWKTMSTTNAPAARYNINWSGGVWTGSKFIIWGGTLQDGSTTNTGGIYDPITDTWKSVTTTNAPAARAYHVMVWTGSKMIVWGGSGATGGVYDPVSDTWTTMSTTNNPGSAQYDTAFWMTSNATSSKMFVFGSNGGAPKMYDPVTNVWTSVSSVNAPSNTRFHQGGVYTGSKVIIWGGYQSVGGATSTGAVFDPVANTWTSTTQVGAPSARYFISPIWTGSRMIVWSGSTSDKTGAAYDPVNDSWTTMTTTNAPNGRYFSSNVWTGSKYIVWGGSPITNSGGIYTPAQYQGNIMAEGDMYIGGQAQVVGDVHAGGYYSRSGSDFAEYMPVDTSLEAPQAGDVVVLSEGLGNRITKSSASSRRYMVGAITDRPAVVGNANPAFKDNPEYALVSMLGQVDVKFSAKNGPVSVGDYLMAGDDGYAVKAKGPGLVLGQALQAGDATSSILTYINPHWWAGDLLTSEGDANFVSSDLNIASQGLATSSTTAFGSNLFSFQGSAWDETSQSAVPTSFSMRNDTVSPTSSFFTLSFATGTNAQSPVLSISNLGDVNVSGDLTVGRRLYLGSKTTGKGSDSTYIYVDDTLSPSSTYIATNADGWQTSSTYDYAERYESSEKLNPGDLVTSDNTGINKVKRATSSLEPILGIVSTKPGFITGGYTKDSYPIALAGRVPTRVSTQNGAIQAGDYLTVSDGNPGLATKAIQSGNIVGIALESFDQPGEGLISVFVKPGYQNILNTDSQAQAPSAQAQPSGSGTGSVRSGLAKIYAGMREVKVTYDKIGAYPLVNATPYAEIKSGFWFEQVADGSFKIVIGETTNFDTVFSWTVQPSVAGSILYNSDNTYVPYDAANGEAFGPQPPETPVEQPTSTQPTATEPVPADISTATSSDAAVIIPTSTMESPQTTTSTP